MEYKKIFRALLLLVTVFLFVSIEGRDSFAEDDNSVRGFYENTTSGYIAIVYDDEYLINSDEVENLLNTMQELTNHGNVLFVTCSWGGAALAEAKDSGNKLFGNTSYVVFIIDMGSRDLGIYVNGDFDDKISKGKCETIADNVYKLASKGQYAECASKVFTQLSKAYKGEKIEAPMQMASNICLSLVIALLINYCLAKLLHGNRKTSTIKMIKETGSFVTMKDTYTYLEHSDRKYSPRSKSSGGGFGGGGGGGHGGSHHF